MVIDGIMEHLLLKKVLIVLVNFNGWKDTIECLGSLLSLDYPDFSILVVDNGSLDDSQQHIKSFAEQKALKYVEYQHAEIQSQHADPQVPRLVIIKSDKNVGFAGGVNIGVRYGLDKGDFEYFWLLNNDTVVQCDSLKYMIEKMNSVPAIGICGSTIRYFDEPAKIQTYGGGYYLRWIGIPWHHGRYFNTGVDLESEKRVESCMNYVEGASMLVSLKFIKEIGLMCEDYFLYFEEIDWAVRAKGHFTLGYASKSVVYHKIGKSIGTSSNPFKKSYISDFFNIRNRILFARRYFPATLPTVYLVLLLEIVVRIVCGSWKRASMIIMLMMRGGGRIGTTS